MSATPLPATRGSLVLGLSLLCLLTACGASGTDAAGDAADDGSELGDSGNSDAADTGDSGGTDSTGTDVLDDSGADDTGTDDTSTDTTDVLDDSGADDTSTDTGSDDTGSGDTGIADDTSTDADTGALAPPVINEVAASEAPDWFELHNPNDQPLALDGWTFSDDAANPARATFAAGLVIPARGYLVQPVDAAIVGFSLGAAEQVVVSDAAGAVVDEVSWLDGDSPAGDSWGRLPDAVGPFTRLRIQTPGAPNVANPEPACGDGLLDPGEECDDGNTLLGDGCADDCTFEVVVGACGNRLLDGLEGCDDGNADNDDGCSATCTLEAFTGLVVINEATASSSTTSDWIELASIAPFAFSLSGFAVSDNQPDARRLVLGASRSLTPGGYLLLVRDEPGSFTWGLGAADGVRLFAPDATLLDTTDWLDGENPIDQSWGRSPDKSGPFSTLATPTPGARN
jgi:cysteine-rich repeat protein